MQILCFKSLLGHGLHLIEKTNGYDCMLTFMKILNLKGAFGQVLLSVKHLALASIRDAVMLFDFVFVGMCVYKC